MYGFCFHNCFLCPHPTERGTFSWGRCSFLSVHWGMTLVRFQGTVLFPMCGWAHIYVCFPSHHSISTAALGEMPWCQQQHQNQWRAAMHSQILHFSPQEQPCLHFGPRAPHGQVQQMSLRATELLSILQEHSAACVGS